MLVFANVNLIPLLLSVSVVSTIAPAGVHFDVACAGLTPYL